MISLVIPVHNEEEILESKVYEMSKYLSSFCKKYEILLAENGSTDNTLSIVKKIARKSKMFSYLSLPKPDMYEAIRHGVIKSRYNKVFWIGIDVDEEIFCIKDAASLLDNFDIVLFSKVLGRDLRPWHRVLINRVYNTIIQIAFGLNVSDVEGYKGYKKGKVIKFFREIKSKKNLFDIEFLILARKNKLKITEIPIIVNEKRKSRFLGSLPKIIRIIFISLKGIIKLKIRYIG